MLQSCLEKAPRLQDAQGERIPIKGYKNVSFVFTAEDGKTILIREKAHFAEGISQPIISYGKWMESGWGIDGCDHALVFGRPEGNQVRIPLRLQNKSLVADCRVRAIGAEAHMEEGLKARLLDDVEKRAKFQSGWKQEGEMWIGVHLGKKYQSPRSMGAI